jgi:hypothetical protein
VFCASLIPIQILPIVQQLQRYRPLLAEVRALVCSFSFLLAFFLELLSCEFGEVAAEMDVRQLCLLRVFCKTK